MSYYADQLSDTYIHVTNQHKFYAMSLVKVVLENY